MDEEIRQSPFTRLKMLDLTEIRKYLDAHIEKPLTSEIKAELEEARDHLQVAIVLIAREIEK